MSDLSSAEQLRAARLQDIPADVVRPNLENVMGRTHRDYEAEYGYRPDDESLAIHFFPPGHSTAPDKDWPNFKSFHDRLEAALLATFPVDQMHASYHEELKSFCVLTPYPNVPDLCSYLDRFFSRIENG